MTAIRALVKSILNDEDNDLAETSCLPFTCSTVERETMTCQAGSHADLPLITGEDTDNLDYDQSEINKT